MRHLQITPLIGLPQLAGWSQVVISPEQTLIIALAIQGPNAGNVGRDVVEILLTSQAESTAEFHALILDLLQQVRQQECALHLSGRLLLDDRTVYAAVNGWVLLKRDTKTGLILSSPADLKIIEGRPQPQDQVVLATNQARDISGEVEQKLGQGFEIDSIITGLVPRVHDQADSSLTALAFIAPATEVNPNTPILELELNVESPPPASEPEVTPVVVPVMPTPLAALDDDVSANPDPILSINDLAEPETAEPISTPNELGGVTDVDTPVLSSLTGDDLTKRDFASQRLEARPSLLHTFNTQARHGFSNWWAKVVIMLRRVGRQGLGQLAQLKDRALARDMYLSKPSPRRLLRVIVPVVAVIMLGSGWWLFTRAQAQREMTAMEQQLQPFKLQVAAAQSKAQREPVAARAELEDVLQKLDQAKNEHAKEPNALKVIDQEIATTRQLFEEISGREEFQALPLFFDLRSVLPSFISNVSDVSGERVVFLDSEQKQLIILNPQTKQTEVKALADLPTPQSLSVLSGEAALVSLGGGIKKVTLTGEPVISELKVEGDSNREAKFMDTFGQFIYVFNPAKNNIYRYAPSETGYSDPVGWLKSAPNLVFDDVSSLQIDGDIWLGTKKGEILRFASGRPGEFAIKGLSQPFNSALLLSTDENAQNLYVLEAGQQRVVVFNKNGDFIKEVKSASLASATHILALEAQNKVLVVSGSLLFEIGL
jgi:hypothetical protein